jgi:hypothetical protein
MHTSIIPNPQCSGCGCSGGGSKGGSCGCGGKGCSVCEAPPEAYSRPEFFSGQLLTEDDLQSLADYTVAKNRLHNRMLFGAGVVCGLRVTHDVCEAERHLIVRPGYAIDCCGNDIVVPCEARLDVVQLVRDLRARMLGKDCGDPCRDADDYYCPEKELPDKPTGVDGEEGAAAAEPAIVVHPSGRGAKWSSYCLYVVYCEHSADPVAPYDDADSCGGGECRYSRVREGYRFELRCGTPSGCEPRKGLGPIRGFGSSPTGKAQHVYDLLAKADKEITHQNREAALGALLQNMVEVDGPYQPGNMNLLAQARSLGLDPTGQRRFNSIVARLLIGLLHKTDCDSMLWDCQPCDEEGVLIACFDFEDCKVTNLCVARRLPILSPAYFSQLGFTQAWRCLLDAACCPTDKYEPTGSLAKLPVSEAGRTPTEGVAAVTAEQAAADEVSIDDLGEYLKARLERIDDASSPESHFTLLPKLIMGFAARITRTPMDVEERDYALRTELSDLRRELDEVRQKLKSIDKGTARKGGNR